MEVKKFTALKLNLIFRSMFFIKLPVYCTAAINNEITKMEDEENKTNCIMPILASGVNI